MKYKNLFFLVFICFSQCHAGFFDFFKNKEETPEDKIAVLRKQQIDYPEDPLINYNLGVALYKQKLFDQAKIAFQRTVEHADDKRDGVLKMQALFNGANSGYQNSLRLLPIGWQTKDDIEDAILNAAIVHVTDAIDYYKKALDINPLLYQAQGNKRNAEELKKQLEEKRKKQQQNPNKQQQKQDKNDQQKNGDSSQKQAGGNDSKNDGSQEKDAEKNRSDQAKNPEDQGKNNPDSDKKNKDAEQQGSKHDDQSKNDQRGDKPSEQERKQAEQEKQASEEQAQGQEVQGQEEQQGDDGKKESAMVKALLDSLGDDEKQSQKRFLNRQMRKDKPLAHPGQKPW